MPNHNFWRGEKVWLHAIEQRDIDGPHEEPDSWLDRANSEIGFPAWEEKDRADYTALRESKDGKDGAFVWAIENNEGQHVGSIGSFDCDPRVGTFKYWILIRREFWRRGYGSEAIKIVLRFYFREMRYQKVTSQIYSFNEQSLRLHEKLGFVQEGRLRRMVYTNGQFYDQLMLGMTKEEFDELDPPAPLQP
jgi:RimJ/RimL family protein N-acetyltransferase